MCEWNEKPQGTRGRWTAKFGGSPVGLVAQLPAAIQPCPGTHPCALWELRRRSGLRSDGTSRNAELLLRGV